MAKDTFTGPLISLGGLAGGPSGGAPREYSDEIGPSIFWAGNAIPATGAIASKDRTGPGAIPSVFCSFPIRTVNSMPAAGGSAAALTVAGLATAGTPLVNSSTYAQGRAVGAPVIVGGIATTGVGLDMSLDTAGFAAGGNITLTTIADAWRYKVGQWVGLLNGGAGGATAMAQISAINFATGVITTSPPPVATVASPGAALALSNRFNPNAYGAIGAPSSLSKLASAGTARIVIPEVGNARGVGIVVTSTGSGGPVLIQGLDLFGTPQSEIITIGAVAATIWGKKTYSMFISATPQYTEAGRNLTVVVSDFIGLPISVMDGGSIVDVLFGGTAEVAGTAYTVIPADTTSPATTSTGDPRGGIQVSANGPATAPGTGLTLNGATVLAIDQKLNPLQVALATTVNPGPLLGVSPV
jgi:hypothetical protein